MLVEENKQTVLYVEDNQLNMALMHHIFKKNLPSVLLLKAETAALGLQIARHKLLDLIILDIGLPALKTGCFQLNKLRVPFDIHLIMQDINIEDLI